MIKKEIIRCKQQNHKHRPIELMEVMVHWIKNRNNNLDLRNRIQLLEVIYQERKIEDNNSDTSTELDNSKEGIRSKID